MTTHRQQPPQPQCPEWATREPNEASSSTRRPVTQFGRFGNNNTEPLGGTLRGVWGRRVHRKTQIIGLVIIKTEYTYSIPYTTNRMIVIIRNRMFIIVMSR